MAGPKAFRLVRQRHDGFELDPLDDLKGSQFFPFERINALNRAGKIVHERDVLLPAEVRPVGRSAVSEADVSTLPTKTKARLDTRYALVQALHDLYREGRVKLTEASISENVDRIEKLAGEFLIAQADLNPSKHGGKKRETVTCVHPSTLLRYYRNWVKYHKSGLVDRIALRGSRSGGLTLEVERLVMAAIQESYLKLGGNTIENTVRDVQKAVRAENAEREAKGRTDFLDVPGRDAIRRRIKGLDRFHVLVCQKGKDVAMRIMRPVGQGLEVSRPLERVEMDEWKIDLSSILSGAGLQALFNEKERKQFGLDDKKARWHLVVAIDARTKIILGLILTKDPSGSSAVECLRMIASDKGDISDATGARLRWEQCGTPELLVTDNGAGFKSIRFTDACNDLGFTFERTLAGQPAMRARIERMFRTCAMMLLPRLKGRTFSNVIERAGQPAEADACLSPEDLCFTLVRWIVDVYHNMPHEGIGGRTPLEQWELDHFEGNYPLKALPSRAEKRCALGLPLTRRATKTGIQVLGVRYHSEELARALLVSGNQTVRLRWDVTDIGAIQVEFDGAWHEVPAVHPGFEGRHAQSWIAARRSLRARDPRRKAWTESIIDEALAAIDRLGQQRSLEFGLIDKVYDLNWFKRVEDELFSGFEVTANVPATELAPDGHGRSILPDPPEASTDASGSEAATTEAPSNVPTPRPRRPGGTTDWDFAD